MKVKLKIKIELEGDRLTIMRRLDEALTDASRWTDEVTSGGVPVYAAAPLPLESRGVCGDATVDVTP